jgi:hypothetical protein
VLFLLSGSSGSGKTTLTRSLPARVPDLVVHEIGDRAEPWDGTRAWRRRLTEQWIERAVEYQRDGLDTVLTEGVLGELLAAPSATSLDGIAACLVDCSDDERLRRIRERPGANSFDDKRLWDFVVWGVWLRFHTRDPQTFAGPIRGDGDMTWAWSRWETWQAGDPRWSTFHLDTTARSIDDSADALGRWIAEQRRLRDDGRLPLSGDWWI